MQKVRDLSEISRVISSRGMHEEVKNLQAYMEKHFSRQEILMEDWKTAGRVMEPFRACNNVNMTPLIGDD